MAFDPRYGEILALSDDKKNHRIYRFSLKRYAVFAAKSDKGGERAARPKHREKVLSQSQPDKKTGAPPLPGSGQKDKTKALQKNAGDPKPKSAAKAPKKKQSGRPPADKRKVFYKLQLEGDIRLLSPKGKKLGFNMDPEGLALLDKNFLIASEGQQIFNPPEPTQIFSFGPKGRFKKAWPVPSMFWDSKRPRRFGARENKGFESLTLDRESAVLWTASEKPLRQDLPNSPEAYVRLTGFSLSGPNQPAGQPKKTEAGAMLFQYSYLLENKSAGLSEAFSLEPKVLLTLERSYKKEKGKKTGVNEVNLFLADCRTASDVSGAPALKPPFAPCSKTLIWASKKQKGIKTDNLEGMALIPFPLPLGKGENSLKESGKRKNKRQRAALAPDAKKALPSPFAEKRRLRRGKQLLILVSDNNFNDSSQKTQFLFFELDLR